MSMVLIRENVPDADRDLLEACLTGLADDGELKRFLGWLMHEVDTHAACISVAMPHVGATIVLIQRRIPECHPNG